jgi:hypothetical protein
VKSTNIYLSINVPYSVFADDYLIFAIALKDDNRSFKDGLF